MGKWAELTKKMERYLRLKSFPVAFKLLEDEKDLLILIIVFCADDSP